MMESGRQRKLERGPGRGRMCAAWPGLDSWAVRGAGDLGSTTTTSSLPALPLPTAPPAAARPTGKLLSMPSQKLPLLTSLNPGGPLPLSFSP